MKKQQCESSLRGTFHVNSTGAKNRSARGARGTIFRRLSRAKHGPNGEIKPTSNFYVRAQFLKNRAAHEARGTVRDMGDKQSGFGIRGKARGTAPGFPLAFWVGRWENFPIALAAT
jgi:hypothetical protein